MRAICHIHTSTELSLFPEIQPGSTGTAHCSRTYLINSFISAFNDENLHFQNQSKHFVVTGGWRWTASLSVRPAFSPGVWACVHLCVRYMHDASLIFISDYKFSWLCCCAGRRAAADGGGCGVAGGCWVSTQGSPVLRAHMTPCLTIWIFMRGICCSLGNSSHLARAAALHRKWLCSWMFQDSSQTRLTPYVISQPLPLDQDTRRIKIIQRLL